MSCLQDIDGFASLAEDMASAPRRWQEWLDLERPEDEPLPGISRHAQLLCFVFCSCLQNTGVDAHAEHFGSHCASVISENHLIHCASKGLISKIGQIDPL